MTGAPGEGQAGVGRPSGCPRIFSFSLLFSYYFLIFYLYLGIDMQLELDTATWDLVLDKNGVLLTLGNSEAPALLSQRIRHRLQTFKGECFLDRSVGVPYFSEIMKKDPDLGRIRSLLASVVAGVQGVIKILSLDLVFTRRTRQLSVTFRVQGDGFIAEGEV